MSNDHPTYPNPTVTEAICDIRFRLPSSREWKPSFAGDLFKRIQNEFPDLEVISLETGLGERPIARFKHKTRSLFLQFYQNSLTINTLPPYQGWQTMRHDALTA